MPEPTLSEIVNIPSDAALGTSGLTDFVPVTRHVNQQIFEAAKFKANMDWAKYQQQLANFKEYVKDAEAISKEDVAAPDRDYLQGELKGIFADIAKNPKSALSGNGMFGIQERLSKLQSDAMQSKQDNAFDRYNRQFLDRVPDMKTDENKAKVDSYLPTQKLGTRQPYILGEGIPEFDADAWFNTALKGATKSYERPFAPVDETGKPLEGYLMQTEEGDEVNPKALKGIWELGLKNDKISKQVKRRYEALPPEIKKQYEENGGVERFFDDLGRDYFNAKLGSYTPNKDGNYWFRRKLSDLKSDPNYLGKERLDQQKKEHKDEMAYKWASLRDKDKKNPETIDQPAILFGNHIDRLKGAFSSGKFDNGMVVQYSAIDPKTRIALGLSEGDKVEYQPDGSYTVIDIDNKQKTKGTIDNLAQGFIEAVKTPDLNPNTDKDGTMAVGFQQKSEEALKKLFGTTSGKKIWNEWKSEAKNGEKATVSEVLIFPDGTEIDLSTTPLSDKEIKEAQRLGAKRKK